MIFLALNEASDVLPHSTSERVENMTLADILQELVNGRNG